MSKKNYFVVLLLFGISLFASTTNAQSGKILMKSDRIAEYPWHWSGHDPMSSSREAFVRASRDLLNRLDHMANIEKFDQFAKTSVKRKLMNKYEEIGKLIRNTTTFTDERNKESAFRGNRRGLIVTIEPIGFKRGTYYSQYKRDPFTGVRSSKAGGIVQYRFVVYAPNGWGESKRIDYTIYNSTNRTIKFQLPSGRWYELAAGKTGKYYNTRSNPRINIPGSNRGDYLLESGRHKFFTMKNGTIGFDRNYAR